MIAFHLISIPIGVRTIIAFEALQCVCCETRWLPGDNLTLWRLTVAENTYEDNDSHKNILWCHFECAIVKHLWGFFCEQEPSFTTPKLVKVTIKLNLVSSTSVLSCYRVILSQKQRDINMKLVTYINYWTN